MATYLHVTPALALAVVIGPQRVPWPCWLVGALVAVAPDADMLLVRWHIDVYGGTYGHRGFTHSLGMAALLACAAWLWPLHGERLCMPWRPVPMAGVPLFGAERLGRELLWLGTPLLCFTALGWGLRRLIMAGCPAEPKHRETERHTRHRHL